VLQTEQKSQLETLRREHEAFVSITEKRQQGTLDAVSKLANQLATVGTNLDSRMMENERRAKEQMSDTMNAVQQNTAVLHRAIGKKFAVELPESLTNQLATLEARIADTNSWPKGSTNMEAMVAELRGLIRQIPPWAEEDYLPRLNALRWAVQSLEVIDSNAPTQGEDLDAAADAYANQLSIQPDGGSTNIAAVLAKQQQDAMTRFATFRRESAINAAKKQIGLAVMTDGLETWQRLAEWTNSANVAELQQRLGKRILEDKINDIVEATKVNLSGLASITNSPLRQAAYVRTLDTLTGQRLDLLGQLDANQDAKMTELAKIIEARIKDGTDKWSRDYQVWAVTEIKQFRLDFENAQNQKQPRSIGPIPLSDKSYTDYNMIHVAIVKHLLPISSSYLERASGQLYSDAFNDGWNLLKAQNQTNILTDIAERDAVTKKKGPLDFMEN
jgi:DNA repair exonuclease SbcCD ATPase subunit